MSAETDRQAVVSWRDYVDSRLEALETANSLSRENLATRLDTMNEFRGQLREQAAGLFTRAEHVIFMEKVNSEITQLRESNARAEGKASQTSVLFAYGLSVIGILVSIIVAILKVRGATP